MNITFREAFEVFEMISEFAESLEDLDVEINVQGCLELLMAMNKEKKNLVVTSFEEVREYVPESVEKMIKESITEDETTALQGELELAEEAQYLRETKAGKIYLERFPNPRPSGYPRNTTAHYHSEAQKLAIGNKGQIPQAAAMAEFAFGHDPTKKRGINFQGEEAQKLWTMVQDHIPPGDLREARTARRLATLQEIETKSFMKSENEKFKEESVNIIMEVQEGRETAVASIKEWLVNTYTMMDDDNRSGFIQKMTALAKKGRR